MYFILAPLNNLSFISWAGTRVSIALSTVRATHRCQRRGLRIPVSIIIISVRQPCPIEARSWAQPLAIIVPSFASLFRAKPTSNLAPHQFRTRHMRTTRTPKSVQLPVANKEYSTDLLLVTFINLLTIYDIKISYTHSSYAFFPHVCLHIQKGPTLCE